MQVTTTVKELPLQLRATLSDQGAWGVTPTHIEACHTLHS